MIDHAMILLFVGLPIGGLFCWLLFDVLLEPWLNRNAWRPNMKTCPTCGARTSASRLVAHAPPPIVPQGSTPPAPLPPQR